MKYKLVIFDLDGTILNTLEDLADSTNYALSKNGYPMRSIDEVRRFVGNGIGKLIERAVPDEINDDDVKRVLADFTTYYGEHCADQTKPYVGVEALINELRKQGYLTAVVSNKADFAVQELCKQYFQGLFDFVVGEREHIRRKPAPDTVFEVLKELHVKVEDAVYIGDSEVDIQTAKNAGMDCFSVLWGFRDEEFLRQNGARKLVKTPVDLIKCLIK